MCLHVCQEFVFTMSMSVSELVAVGSLSNEHREMNASESTICGILCCVSLMVVLLRSCAGGRLMVHADSVSGLQASLLNLKFSSHFI